MRIKLKDIIVWCLLLVSSISFSQNNIKKGSGIIYTAGPPTVTINTDYHSEWAVDTTNNKKIYLYDRDAGAWILAGYFIQPTNVVGVPTHTPHDAQSIIAINNGDSLYHYRSGSWRLVSGGGSGTTDLTIGGSGPTFTIESSTGTDVTISGGGIITLSESPANTLIITGTEVDGSITNEIQQIDTFEITNDSIRLSLSSDGVLYKKILINDNSKSNEGLVTFTIAANEGQLNSNTIGNNIEYFAGRGILVLTDSAGYNIFTATEVDGSISNEGLLSTNRSSDSTVYRYTTNTTGSETLYLKEGSNISFSSPSSGAGIDTLIISASASGVDTTYFHHQGGNSYGTQFVVGSNDNFGVNFRTNSINRMRLDTSGTLTIGASSGLAITNSSIAAITNFTLSGTAATLTLSSTTGSASAILFNTTNTTNGGATFGNQAYTNTLMAKTVLTTSDSYTVASGTGTLVAYRAGNTLNCTSTWSGYGMGFYSNPTLTNIASGTYYNFYVGTDKIGSWGFYNPQPNTKNYTAAPSIHDNYIEMQQMSAPATPANSYGRLYKFTDDSLYFINEAGNNINLCRGTSGSGYSREEAQDDWGAMVNASLSYDDATPRAYITPRDYGDITATDSGRTWTIDAAQVTYAKIQDVATDKLLGRDAAGTGSVTAIGVSGGIEFTGSDVIQTSAFTGDVTKTAGGTALTIANDAVTYAKIQNVSAASKLLGRGSAGGSGDVEEITLGTNLSMSGTTLNATAGGADGNGIYSGSGTVRAGAYAKISNNMANPRTFGLGYFEASPEITQSARERGFMMDTSGYTWLMGADSANAVYTYLRMKEDILFRSLDVGFANYAGLEVQKTFIQIDAQNTIDISSLKMHKDSATLISDAFRINVDTLSIKIGGSHGTAGYPLVANGGTLVTYSQLGTAGLSNDAVTYAKIQNVSAASKLLGRGSAGGSGDVEEITLGTGLSMSGTTLSSTGGTGTSIYTDNGTVDSTRYAQLHVDSILTFGYISTHPTLGLNGKERALYFDGQRRVNLVGGDSATAIYTLVQLSSAVSTFSSKSDLSDFTHSELTTGAITLRARDVGDSQDSYWFIKPDSIHGTAARFRVDVDSFHLKIAGSNGTNGYVLKSNGPGWSATWQPDATGGVIDADYGDITVSGGVWNIDPSTVGSTEITNGSIAAVDVNDDEIILQNGNTIATAVRIGSDDNFGCGLQTNSVNRIYIDSVGVSTFNYDAHFTTGLRSREPNATATNRGFDLRTRDVSLAFPVPSLRPSTANTVIAFDVMPNGTATEHSNGFAWIDVCNSDVLTTSSTRFNALRLGSRLTYMEVGSKLFNGDTSVPLYFTMQNNATTLNALVIDTTGFIGIGTTAPTASLHQVAGTIADLKNAFRLTATLPTVTTALINAVDWQVTTAGSSAFSQQAFNINLLAGYTGSASTVGMFITNAAAGTATTIYSSNNRGFLGVCSGTTTGTNIGGLGVASNGDISIGLVGRAGTTKNAGTNIGVFGSGLNAGTTPIEIGGYFGMHSANPTFVSAALIADNGATTNPIFLARDNGTVVFQIQDNSKMFHSAGNFAATLDATTANFVLRKAITGTAATELFIDGAAVQAVLPATNAIWNVEINLIATCTAQGNGTTVAGESFVAKRYCGISRLNTTTALIGAVETIGTDKSNTTMSTSATTITADDTNEALKITFTPPITAGSTTTFRVVATYIIVQVQY